MPARIAVLLHDYTSVADKDEDGKPTAEWHIRMSDGARSLEKLIGNKMLESLLLCLDNGEYSKFAETALTYYDGLYHKHLKNAEGRGGGAGVRAATAIDVVVNPTAIDVDGEGVGRQVLEALIPI